MTKTLYLRYADRDAAMVALAALGMTATDRDGAVALPSPGYLGGVRFDAIPLGGDGVYRQQTGTKTVTLDGIGPIEMPVYTAQPGYHIDIAWHGDAPPDFGSALVTPGGDAWAYEGASAAGLPSAGTPASVTAFQARAALIEAGLLSAVEAAVAGADEITRAAWEHAQSFERTSSTIASVASALSLTAAQIDALFVRAARISA